jgi:hypothetical protein
VPEEVAAGGVGAEVDEVGLVDPAAVVLDVGLEEDRDGVVGDGAAGERGGVDEPAAPAVEAEGGELGMVGE